MNMKLLLFLIVLVFRLGQTFCQEAEIHVERATIMLNKDRLSIVCRPKLNGAGYLDIYGIQLIRNVQSVSSKIVSASNGRDSLIWHDGSLEGRAAASFNLSSVSTAYLKLDIEKHDVACSDGSHYICEITGQYHDFSNGIMRAGVDITIRVDPDNIDDIAVCPMEKGRSGIYPVGASIRLMCRSTVGYPARNILWCLKRSTDRVFRPISLTDQRFIQDDPLVIGCQSERKGFLSYTVTNEDDETVFMCTVSESDLPNDCTTDAPKSMFLLHKNSTDSINSVCDTLVSEGKVKKEMNIDGIDIRKRDPSSSSPIFSIGSRLALSCIGNTSGSMSTLKIHWCIKRSFDVDFYKYPFGDNIVNGAVESIGVCRYKITSTLFHNVTLADTETKFMCQLGVTDMKSVCGQGRLSKTTYVRLYQEKTTIRSKPEITTPTTEPNITIERVSSKALSLPICSSLLFLLASLLSLSGTLNVTFL